MNPLVSFAMTHTLGLVAVANQSTPSRIATTSARVDRIQGSATISPSGTPVSVGTMLSQRDQITTSLSSSARLTLSTGTQLQLAPETSMSVFGPPVTPPSRRARQPVVIGTETEVQSGIVYVRVPDNATTTSGRPYSFAIRAGVGLLTVRRGASASIRIDGGVTRVMVFAGTATFRTARGEVRLEAGAGARAEVAHPVMMNTMPTAPTWKSPPPDRLLTTTGQSSWTGALAFASSVRPLSVRIQRANSQNFDGEVFEEWVVADPATGALPTLTLPTGVWYVRASVVDRSRMESAWSPVVSTQIVQPVVRPATSEERAKIEIPLGFYCSLNGGQFLRVMGPLTLAPLHAHQVRCSARAEGDNAVEFQVPLEQAGTVQWFVRASPEFLDPEGGIGTVLLRVREPSGAPVRDIAFAVEPSAGLRVNTPRETTMAGTYTATIQWPRGVSRGSVRFVANGLASYTLVLEPPVNASRE